MKVEAVVSIAIEKEWEKVVRTALSKGFIDFGWQNDFGETINEIATRNGDQIILQHLQGVSIPQQ